MFYFAAYTLAMLTKALIKSKKKHEVMLWQIITPGKKKKIYSDQHMTVCIEK